MDICVYKKGYFKETNEVQKAINCAIVDLYGRITSYEKQQVPFGKIFNDDRVKYDKHGDFYTFKYQKSNLQLRILYAYIFVDGVPVIIVADFVIKKRIIRIISDSLKPQEVGIHIWCMRVRNAL